MVLCGLWHGASFTFIAWGAYHGALLVGERLLEKIVGVKRMQSIPRAASIAVTFALVTVGWVFFRSQTFEQAGRVLANMFLLHGAGNILHLCQPALLMMIAICALIVWGLRTNTFRQDWRPVWWRVALVLLLFIVGTLGIFVTRETPFLYFQF
jgi:alginate O-acetyltransferase complex protein AlgI